MASRTSNRRPLTIKSIAEAALRLIDREGLSALSMRRVAAELGVEAMAIYHHLPNKEALVEAVVTHGTPEALTPPGGDWRSDLRALANAVHRQFSAHPALLPLRWKRRTAGAEAKVIREREREIFRAARLDEALSRDAHRLLGSYLIGSIVAQAEARNDVSSGDWTAQFNIGLDLLIDGIETRRRREARLSNKS
jgi:TetR/AcrR family transcriptional regulator, tetracycline repressor protein